MKKILCLIDTLGMGGGAERQMAGLALLLNEKGYKIDLVTYYNQETYPELSNQNNINLTTLDAKNNKWSKIIAIRKHIKSVGGYDWVIAYKDGPTIISCLLKLLGVKYRLIVSERNTNQNLSIKDKVKFYLYRFADQIVPNSYSQTDFINKNFPNLKKRVVTITNFTDTTHFHPIESNINTKLNILTVGRLTSQKNILKYLEAIKLLKQDGYVDKVHFNWYGDAQTGDDTYKETCFKKIKELDISDIVTFHPATKDIVKHYQTCNIFCLPSSYEGFPNVVCEAMSCGKPIVCSRVCDNPHIVQEGVNGLLFDPTDINSIYLTLKQIIEMPKSELLKWGASSRSIAEMLFSKDAFVKKYIELIEA